MMVSCQWLLVLVCCFASLMLAACLDDERYTPDCSNPSRCVTMPHAVWDSVDEQISKLEIRMLETWDEADAFDEEAVHEVDDTEDD